MGYGLNKEGAAKAAVRSVLLASSDAHFRRRLREQLTAMRWQVREAAGGAEAMCRAIRFTSASRRSCRPWMSPIAKRRLPIPTAGLGAFAPIKRLKQFTALILASDTLIPRSSQLQYISRNWAG